MKTTATFSSFVEEFHRMNRYDQFGYKALRIIYDYLEEYEDSTGTEVELDVIAICCDFCVSDWETIAKDYRIDLGDIDVYNDEEEAEKAVIDYLNNHTIVLGTCEDGIVYQVF